MVADRRRLPRARRVAVPVGGGPRPLRSARPGRARPPPKRCRRTPPKQLPITIGVGEPFTTTLTVVGYFALLFTLPVLLYEAYAFVIPALKPERATHRRPADARRAGAVHHRRRVRLLRRAAARGPLPPGLQLEQFDILVQAKTYYTFQILTMLGIGLAFQFPLGLLALQRLGVDQCRHADAELALRYRHHRGHRGRHARGRSGHDRPGDAPARRACIWPVS